MKRNLYDADHKSFATQYGAFTTVRSRPAGQVHRGQAVPREVWLAFGRQGLLGLGIPEQYGGSAAGDFRYNAVLCEELGRVSMSLSSCHGIHADIVAPYLVELTSEEQRERWLPGMCVRQDPHGHRHDRGVRRLEPRGVEHHRRFCGEDLTTYVDSLERLSAAPLAGAR